jgi:hypothetical protein
MEESYTQAYRIHLRQKVITIFMAIHHSTTLIRLIVCLIMTFFLLALIQPTMALADESFPIIAVLHAGGLYCL